MGCGASSPNTPQDRYQIQNQPQTTNNIQAIAPVKQQNNTSTVTAHRATTTVVDISAAAKKVAGNKAAAEKLAADTKAAEERRKAEEEDKAAAADVKAAADKKAADDAAVAAKTKLEARKAAAKAIAAKVVFGAGSIPCAPPMTSDGGPPPPPPAPPMDSAQQNEAGIRHRQADKKVATEKQEAEVTAAASAKMDPSSLMAQIVEAKNMRAKIAADQAKEEAASKRAKNTLASEMAEKEREEKEKEAAELAANPEPVYDPNAEDVVSPEIAHCDESLLYVIRLDIPNTTAEELSVVFESQKSGHLVRVSDKDGPGNLDTRVGCLSWRWDIAKPKTVEEAKALPPSKKIIAAINQARKLGLKWLWLDWLTVPQYPAADEEILNHVRASRFVYEQCTIILVDLIEIIPGLSIPTTDYISRLWTTAEMASMLANPSVNYGTFVQIHHWHSYSLILASQAIFSSNMIRTNFVSDYLDFFNTYKNKETIFENFGFTQDRIHMICYNIASTELMAKYGNQLFNYLISNSNKFSERFPSPLTMDEETKLINDFSKTCDWDARKSEHCKGIFDAIKISKKMPNSFDMKANYKGFLLLAVDCFRILMTKWQFNGGAYKSVLQRLGQSFPNTPIVKPTDKGALKCFIPSDVEKVRQMIMAARGRVQFPLIIPGIKWIPVPLKQWLTVNYPLPAELTGKDKVDLGAVLNQCTLIAKPSLNDDTFPLRMVSIMVHFAPSGIPNTPAILSTTSLDLYCPQSVVRFQVRHNYDLKHSSVTIDNSALWTKEHNQKERMEIKLEEGEFWISLYLTFSLGVGDLKTLYLICKVKQDSSLSAKTFGNIINPYLAWCENHFKKLLTDDDRRTFLMDVDGSKKNEMESILKSCGVNVVPNSICSPNDPIESIDSRPELPEADQATVAFEIAEKQKKIEQLLSIPSVISWGLTLSQLTMMPIGSIETLITQAEMLEEGERKHQKALEDWKKNEETSKKNSSN